MCRKRFVRANYPALVMHPPKPSPTKYSLFGLSGDPGDGLRTTRVCDGTANIPVQHFEAHRIRYYLFDRADGGSLGLWRYLHP